MMVLMLFSMVPAIESQSREVENFAPFLESYFLALSSSRMLSSSAASAAVCAAQFAQSIQRRGDATTRVFLFLALFLTLCERL